MGARRLKYRTRLCTAVFTKLLAPICDHPSRHAQCNGHIGHRILCDECVQPIAALNQAPALQERLRAMKACMRKELAMANHPINRIETRRLSFEPRLRWIRSQRDSMGAAWLGFSEAAA